MQEAKPKIWLSSPHMGGNEINYIKEAFDTNWIAPLGPHVDAFEKVLSEYCDTKHCAALSSGTSAIHLALIMLGVGPGDFVICQSFTFAASANPIAYLGATPVFIDSESDTWNMDPVLLEKAITEINTKIGLSESSSKTLSCPTSNGVSMGENDRTTPQPHDRMTGKIKAIIPVHLYGMPAKMEEIMAIGKKYNIPVIEDAAEALGSKYYYKPAGSIGQIGILSFNGNKIITTSGGGALLSDDPAVVSKARFLATQARDNAPHYQHSQIGYNYRMSNVVAGIGLGQMEVLNDRVTKRRTINRLYRDNLSGISGISFQTEPAAGFYSNYWLTAITIDPSLTGGVSREDIRLAMAAENIEVRPLWKPLHIQPVFGGALSFSNGTSESLFKEGLCLPSGSNLTEMELRRVMETFIKALHSLNSKKQKAA